MNKVNRRRISRASLSLAALLLCAPASHGAPEQPAFQSAQRDYQWSFPKDHAPHEAFQTEWWYYTGQLFAETAQPFQDKPLYGFQLTFFRRSESPGQQNSSEYLAHAALTDIRAGTTMFAVRVGGALLGAAGASKQTLEVWSGDWLAELINDLQIIRFSPDKAQKTHVRLSGKVSASPWLQGEQGFSRKGSCETCASQYYSIPRIPLTGEIRNDSGIRSVTGFGWMDHEFMSNTLAADQVGWDWLGLMLRDGRSLTVFRLRDLKGGTSFASANLLSEGSSEPIAASEVILTPGDEWQSPKTGAKYPLTWRVQIPSRSIDLTVKARVPASEIGEGGPDLAPQYWEGPVATADESAIGYLEMTGYAGKVKL